MKEKKDFSNSKFNKRVRISEENLEWLKKNKKKGAISVFLESIIDNFKKDVN